MPPPIAEGAMDGAPGFVAAGEADPSAALRDDNKLDGVPGSGAPGTRLDNPPIAEGAMDGAPGSVAERFLAVGAGLAVSGSFAALRMTTRKRSGWRS
jgi:hypothetical protein